MARRGAAGVAWLSHAVHTQRVAAVRGQHAAAVRGARERRHWLRSGRGGQLDALGVRFVTNAKRHHSAITGDANTSGN